MDAPTILLRIRAALGITRTDLARLAQLSPSTVGRIEKGMLDPTWGTLTRILESTGFRLHGENVFPTGDASAAQAARILLDDVLLAADAKPMGRTLPEPVQTWMDRWRRAGWISDHLTAYGLSTMASVAGVISEHARRDTSRRAVGDGRRWRELALRVDEAGFDYAVSHLASTLEMPGTAVCATPIIYVHEPADVAALLSETDSDPERGVLLVGTDGFELEGTVTGHAMRFTSLGQALMDGLASAGRAPTHAEFALRNLVRSAL